MKTTNKTNKTMENQLQSTNQQVRCDAIVLAGWWLIDCFFLQISPLAARRRLEKCEKGKAWTEDHGKGGILQKKLLGKNLSK